MEILAVGTNNFWLFFMLCWIIAVGYRVDLYMRRQTTALEDIRREIEAM